MSFSDELDANEYETISSQIGILNKFDGQLVCCIEKGWTLGFINHYSNEPINNYKLYDPNTNSIDFCLKK